MRYAECDQMGFVHHSVYAVYFEEARTEILRSFGLIYAEMENEGIIMPVRSMQITFFKAAKYDDLLTIKVDLPEKPALRYNFIYEVHNQVGEKLCTATTELFFVRKSDFRPIRLPEKYQVVIDALFED